MLSLQRNALAVALAELDGVNGLEFVPMAPKVRDAWPVLESMERGPGLTFLTNWRILVWLGQDERTAQVLGDELLHTIAGALAPVAYVESGQFVTLATTAAGDVFAIEFKVRCEE